MQYLTLVALIVGLLMYLLCKDKAEKIGLILFAAACIGICIAAAPATTHLLQK